MQRGRVFATWLLLLAVVGCESAAPKSRFIPAAASPIQTAGRAAPPQSSNAVAPTIQVSVAGQSGSLMQPSVTSGSTNQADCGTVTHNADAKPGAADIVWIVDASPSMVDELDAVRRNLAAFADSISSAGIDHHVVMIGQDNVAAATPLGMDAEHYLFVPALVDSHNLLQVLLELYPAYQAFLRVKASLNFVVVTDDESFLPAAAFQSRMEQMAQKKFLFHAIASEDVNGLPCVGACGLPVVCGGAAPGRQYYALAEETGGQRISVCVSDWSQVFEPLKQAVIESAPLPCAYAIPAPPSGEVFDADRVNLEFVAPSTAQRTTLPRAPSEGACADRSAWFYDDPVAPKEIKMCPAACQALSAGGTVQIALGCATVLQ